MDKFTEMREKREKMPAEEKERAMIKNRSMCICGECPTYSSCMKEKDELLYCLNGKSVCPAVMKGCICPTCPVTGMMGLGKAYYCARGSEQELRGK